MGFSKIKIQNLLWYTLYSYNMITSWEINQNQFWKWNGTDNRWFVTKKPNLNMVNLSITKYSLSIFFIRYSFPIFIRLFLIAYTNWLLQLFSLSFSTCDYLIVALCYLKKNTSEKRASYFCHHKFPYISPFLSSHKLMFCTKNTVKIHIRCYTCIMCSKNQQFTLNMLYWEAPQLYFIFNS